MMRTQATAVPREVESNDCDRQSLHDGRQRHCQAVVLPRQEGRQCEKHDDRYDAADAKQVDRQSSLLSAKVSTRRVWLTPASAASGSYHCECSSERPSPLVSGRHR